MKACRRTAIVMAGCVLALTMAPVTAKNNDAFPPEVMTEGFLSAHPDLRWRGEGLSSYQRKDYAVALTQLQRAARHADKASQAIVAEMYWNGVGVEADRVMGYIWMDLAAERMYHDFVVLRERYWGELNQVERAAVIERGRAVYAEYGDEVAKPRLEKILRRERRRATGSRTGSVNFLTIIPATGPLAGTGFTIPGDMYYAPKYWQPEKYWQLQDTIWKAPLKGRVSVGDVETLPTEHLPRTDDQGN